MRWWRGPSWRQSGFVAWMPLVCFSLKAVACWSTLFYRALILRLAKCLSPWRKRNFEGFIFGGMQRWYPTFSGARHVLTGIPDWYLHFLCVYCLCTYPTVVFCQSHWQNADVCKLSNALIFIAVGSIWRVSFQSGCSIIPQSLLLTMNIELWSAFKQI